MAERSIFVGMLAYDGKMEVQTHLALTNSIQEFHQRGWTYEAYVRTWDSVVSRARNILVGNFLKSKCTDFVMIDNDVTWPAGALTKLIENPVDVVAGIYRTKQDPEDYRFLHESSRLKTDPVTGLLPVHHIPLGFMRATRPAIERMVEACKDDWFSVEDHPPEFRAWPLFEFQQRGHQSWGEDYVFCSKWRALGGEVYVDPELWLGHSGGKTFYGNFHNWLKGIQAQQVKAAVNEKTFMP